MGRISCKGSTTRIFVDNILVNIKPPKKILWWMNQDGFSIWRGDSQLNLKWEYIRHNGQLNSIYKKNWVKGFPLKVALLMWRLWKFKIAVDDKVRRWGYEGLSRCWYCEKPSQKTMMHVFLRTFTANWTWSFYSSCAEFNIKGLPLREFIMLWWNAEVNRGIRIYYNTMTSIIVWELWKKRNQRKHEGKWYHSKRLFIR